jgi:hypothetical protein
LTIDFTYEKISCKNKWVATKPLEIIMTERQRVIESLQYDMRYQAMLFVKRNGRKLLALGLGDMFSIGDYMELEKYMIENKKDANNITIKEVVEVISKYRLIRGW